MSHQTVHVHYIPSSNPLITFCKDVYNITFFEDHEECYGKDIDIAARLLTKAKENSIAISETFYQKILNDLKNTGDKPDISCLRNVFGIYIKDFKGIP